MDALVDTPIEIDATGTVTLGPAPGIGVQANLVKAQQYVRHVQIKVSGRTLGATAEDF